MFENWTSKSVTLLIYYFAIVFFKQSLMALDKCNVLFLLMQLYETVQTLNLNHFYADNFFTQINTK